jgi:predicted GNAT family acetyltransferase
MRVYALTRVMPAAPVPGQMRRAGPGDRDLIMRWYRAFMVDTFGEAEARETDVARAADNYLTTSTRALYFWHDPEPVAMAAMAGTTPGGARIGAVYTPPEKRRRGYASALVAGLSQHMLDQGRRFCFLFTDLANPTSNHIYQAIGYEPVGDADEFLFGPPV